MLLEILAFVLVANLSVSLFFILKTKTDTSKMLVTLLFSTTGVAVLLLLYETSQHESILDVALVFVLLSSVTAVVFAKRLRYLGRKDG